MSSYETIKENSLQRINLSSIGACQGLLIYLVFNPGKDYLGELASLSILFFLLLTPGLCFLILKKESWYRDILFAVTVGGIGSLLFVFASGLLGSKDIPDSFYLTMVVSGAVLFVVPVAFYQTQRDVGRRTLPYRNLFLHAWTNKLVLLIGGLFLGAGWIILALWSGLFDLIGIDFFGELFYSAWFALIFSGAALGLGMAIAREKPFIIHSLLQIILTIFKFLTPVLGAVAILFILTLPFTGLEKLWNTGFSTALLLSVLFAFILCENAVIQTGEEANAFPRPIQGLVMAANVVLPAFAVLAGFAIMLRVGQYGWTPERLYMALLSIVGFLYGISYALSVILSRKQWILMLTRINPPIALFVLLLAMMVHLPPLEAYHLTAGDQLARLRDDRIQVENFDFAYLKFKLGAAGREALEAIKSDEILMVDPLIQKKIEVTAELTYYPRSYGSRDRSRRPADLSDVPTYVEVIPMGFDLPEAPIKDWVERSETDFINCYRRKKDQGPVCAFISTDIDLNGLDDLVFMNIWLNMSSVLQVSEGNWSIGPDLRTDSYAYVNLTDKHRELLRALRQGKIRITPPVSQNLTIGEVLFKVQ